MAGKRTGDGIALREGSWDCWTPVPGTGGVGASGNGGRLGGARANLEAFTETQWVTVRGGLPAYPF